jgi:hypothetical protein
MRLSFTSMGVFKGSRCKSERHECASSRVAGTKSILENLKLLEVCCSRVSSQVICHYFTNRHAGYAPERASLNQKEEATWCHVCRLQPVSDRIQRCFSLGKRRAQRFQINAQQNVTILLGGRPATYACLSAPNSVVRYWLLPIWLGAISARWTRRRLAAAARRQREAIEQLGGSEQVFGRCLDFVWQLHLHELLLFLCARCARNIRPHNFGIGFVSLLKRIPLQAHAVLCGRQCAPRSLLYPFAAPSQDTNSTIELWNSRHRSGS